MKHPPKVTLWPRVDKRTLAALDRLRLAMPTQPTRTSLIETVLAELVRGGPPWLNGTSSARRSRRSTIWLSLPPGLVAGIDRLCAQIGRTKPRPSRPALIAAALARYVEREEAKG